MLDIGHLPDNFSPPLVFHAGYGPGYKRYIHRTRIR